MDRPPLSIGLSLDKLFKNSGHPSTCKQHISTEIVAMESSFLTPVYKNLIFLMAH